MRSPFRRARALGTLKPSLVGFALVLATGCASRTNTQAQQPTYAPQAPYGTQPYGANGAYGTQPGPYGTQPAPYGTQPPATSPQYASSAPPAPMTQPSILPPAGGVDLITIVDTAYLRSTAQGILNELVAALPPAQQSRVLGIPMLFDPAPGEVNAFAACTEGGKSLMAMTDGLLDVTAHLAQAAANDELFGTRKVDEYLAFIGQNQRPGQPIVRPGPGFFAPAHANDPRRIARQHALFEEQVAFVLGHELAHHYLGHLPCTASGPVAVTTSELGNALSGALPLLNQPNELAADVAGTNNVLTTGRRRATNQWTEGGALITMRFFQGIERFSAADVLFAFEHSHPPALIRQPVIMQTAATYRATGGAQLLFPF